MEHSTDPESSRSSCVKIYLCSNPEDSVEERRALRQCVFPTLREYCRHTHGLDFRALLGEQYGAARLPAQVEVAEFQLALQTCQRAGGSTRALERAYLRDENAVPPSFRLRGRVHAGRHACAQSDEKKGDREEGEEEEEEGEEEEEEGEEEVTKVLQDAVSQCVLEGLMTTERAQSYFRSALDVDLRFALENRTTDDIINRCLVYVHTIANQRGRRPEEGRSPATTLTKDGLLSQLRDDFLSSLVTSCQLLVYTTTSVRDHGHHGYSPAERRSYIEGLCAQMQRDLLRLIDSSVSVTTTKRSPGSRRHDDALAREQAEQEELCRVFSRLYDIKRPEEEEVKAYLGETDAQRPLLVEGGNCTGKTVLLAHCAQQCKSWMADRDPAVVVLFADLSISPSPKRLLSGLCYQIAQSYGYARDRHPDRAALNPEPNRDRKPPVLADRYSDPLLTLPQLRKELSSLLSLLPSPKRPLVLILDGLDLVPNTFRPHDIQILPSPLPPNVKLLLSVSPTRTATLAAIRLHYPAGIASVELCPVGKRERLGMLAALLGASGRRVTSGQQAAVNQALASCSLTLYVRLLHTHAALWSSGSEVISSSLPVGVHTAISALLARLETKHGVAMASSALSYLSLSRTGLTAAELTDLLSCNDETLAAHVPQDADPSPARMRFPEVEVEMLLLDLKGFVARRRRGVAGRRVLFWVSRHFGLVVRKRYLSSRRAGEEIHSDMADYFGGRWAHGRAKPLVLSQNAGPDRTGAVSDTARMKIYIDRQPQGQPYVFNSTDNPSSLRLRVNLRKLLELPHHLLKSNRWEELGRGLMMSLEFHQTMLRVGLLGELLALLEEGDEWGEEDGGSQLPFPRERGLLAGILKASACLLRSSPLELPAAMESALAPFLGVYPELGGYTRELERRRRGRGSGLGVLLSPSPSSVPSTQTTLETAKRESAVVTDAAGTECGAVVTTLDDGSAWVWRAGGRRVRELSRGSELSYAGAKSSGTFVLLSTGGGRLFLWDASDPWETAVREVETDFRRCASEPERSAPPPAVNGFVVRGDRMCVWWEGLSLVGVRATKDQPLARLPCHDPVTCVSFPSGGDLVYCGQENGTVSILDVRRRSLVARCSVPTERAFISVVFSEDEEEMACVDGAGNVFVWEVAGENEQPSLIKERYSESGAEKIRNTDHSEEARILLVCEAPRILLWDSDDWELWDEFLAPRGRAFAQAMVAHGGHLLLATIEACPSVLAWRITTGQCVLSLGVDDDGPSSHPVALLKTGSAMIAAVARNGRLAAWDSEVVRVAGAAPRTAASVRRVAPEPVAGEGERFYVSDGSETVWRWSLRTGSPEARFLHDGPVEEFCLSPGGGHLVTLAGGEVYVWQCETGRNLHRIHGSKATNVLVTPNGHFGVCLSECGPSRVWKLDSGHVVCNIHLYLSDAQISSESTFLIGRRRGDLLACSLWSGSVSKRFSSAAGSCATTRRVLAFRTLPENPDLVLVLTATGGVYTWMVAKETVCMQVQLPHSLASSRQPRVFQMSPDGSYALLSTDDDVITFLDLSRSRLCTVRAEGPVLHVCLDDNGSYAAVICRPSARCCDPHGQPVLTVVRLEDGGTVGRLRLGKNPSTLGPCERLRVYVGFQDGSVGVYSVCDTERKAGTVRGRVEPIGQESTCLCDREPQKWLPLATPSIIWAEPPDMV